MSGIRSRPERLVALSLAIYTALLVLYPKPFRRAYAAEMARVFWDSCRAARQRGGVAGLARVWRVTLGDLVMTALAERVEQDVNVTRSALYRATSLLSLIGVAAWMVGATGVMLLELETAGRLNQAMAPMRPAVLDMAPLLLSIRWIFFAIGVVGLYAWLSARRGALVWIPGAFAITALIAMSVMELDWPWFASVILGLAWPPHQPQLSNYIGEATGLGYLAIGLALLTSGLMTLSTPALRGASRALVLMGVFGVAYYVLWYTRDTGLASLFTHVGQRALLARVWQPIFYVFTVVWLGWGLLLGRQLWRAGASQEPAVAAAERG